MSKYRVRYYKAETNLCRYDIDVEANSPEEARQRVLDGFAGETDLSEEEMETECAGKEFCEGTEFSHLEDEDDPYAVALVEED